jgi:hypothetical protein
MSIEKMMCLSTGHVSYETSVTIGTALIEEKMDYNERDEGLPEWWNNLPVYEHGEYGWLICIAGDCVEHLKADAEAFETFPADLLTVMEHATANGCDWLLLDRDAELIDDLPQFDW